VNVVFIGGGSFWTLPVVRGAMQDPGVFNAGEIRLVDFNLPRVETVARLIMRTPEFAKSGCRVTWTDKLEKALPGADVVSVSFPVGSYRVNTLSEQACARHGLFGNDQLSASGAFRAVTGGTVLLGIARLMEKHCSKAWLVDFANPVAIYSGMVNNHTRIRALGICAGFNNHRWDMTRPSGP
jgi:6-phospho-beta-glucosidase